MIIYVIFNLTQILDSYELYRSIILDNSRPSRLHESLKAVGDSEQFLEFFSTIGSSTAGNDEPGIGEREEPIIPKSPQKMSDRDCLPWLTRNPLLIMMEGPIKQTYYNLPIEFIPLLETFKCRIELEYTEY